MAAKRGRGGVKAKWTDAGVCAAEQAGQDAETFILHSVTNRLQESAPCDPTLTPASLARLIGSFVCSILLDFCIYSIYLTQPGNQSHIITQTFMDLTCSRVWVQTESHLHGFLKAQRDKLQFVILDCINKILTDESLDVESNQNNPMSQMRSR